MTNKEKLQSLSLDDLADWLNIHGEVDIMDCRTVIKMWLEEQANEDEV